MRKLACLLGLSIGLAGAWAGAACSSSDSGGPTVDAGDAAVDVAKDVQPVDAGPDNEQDPNVYPAKHQAIPQLDYHGGPILDQPKIVTITFVGDNSRDSVRSFDHFIVSQQAEWWSIVMNGITANGKSVTYGSNGGDVEVPDTVSGQSLADSDVQAFIQKNIDSIGADGGVPADAG